MTKLLSLAAVMALLAALYGCNQAVVYENESPQFDAGWAYADTLRSEFSIEDTTTIYNLLLRVEHSTDFPFQNFYTRIYTTFPDGTRIQQPLSLELAAPNGTWLGDCGGESCSVDIVIQSGAYFNVPGQYAVTLEQFSRQNPLPGISRVAFVLEKSEEQR